MKLPTIPRRALAAALSATLLLSACASLLDSGTPEEQVARLAQKRWDALVKRDFNAAYEYITPAYRAAVSPDSYKSRFGTAGRWKEAKVDKAVCEAERCTVGVKLTTTNLNPITSKSLPEIITYHDETWVRDEGRWWFYQTF